MDPDEALRQLRNLFLDITEKWDVIGEKEDELYEAEHRGEEEMIREHIDNLKSDVAVLAEEGIDLFSGLDRWLRSGGFLPRDWAIR